MFCPFCGREFSERDSRYCPFCGQDLSSPDDPLIDKVRYSNIWKMRSSLLIGTLVIILLIAGIAYVMQDPGETVEPEEPLPEDDSPEHTPVDKIIEIDESSRIVLGDDFADESLKAFINIGDQLVISLNKEISSKHSYYSWVLRDELSNTYLMKDKAEPEIIWVSPSVGQYSVIAYCYVDETDTEPAMIVSGSILYQGDKTQHYSWIHDGRAYETEAVIPISDQQKYSAPNIVYPEERQGKIMNSAFKFVVTDGAVALLEESLNKSYSRWNGAVVPGDYGYADFVLSFVQSMGYAYDSMNHYQDDYWAFPAETLFNGCGDEEDLSFLYASLMKTAGYTCGLFSAPGTMMVAVHTDIPQISPAEDHRAAVVMENGDMFLVCEPYSDLDPCLGTVRDCYGFDLNGEEFYYYGQKAEGHFGFMYC